SESCQLFSGFAGTGKSTELRQLAHRLEEEGYAVLLINAEDYLTLSEPLVIDDLLVVLAAAFGDAVGERLGRDVVGAGYGERLLGFLQQEVRIQDAKLKLPAGIADVKVDLSYEEPFWREACKVLKVSLKTLGGKSHGFIGKCIDLLRKKRPGMRGVVFIVDNLERIQPLLPDQFREIMTSVLRVLNRHADFLRLPGCHTIYSVPPYVGLAPGLSGRYDGKGFVLPAVKVSEPGLPLRCFGPGIEAMTELLERRIPVERVFKDRRDLLERLILYSGGHVRTLIWFTQNLLGEIRRGGVPPSDGDLEEVVRLFREGAKLKIGRSEALLLDRISETGSVEGLDEDQRTRLASMMDDYQVLCYLNGENRYEVHPLIREHVHVRAQQLRQDKAS
ncbi:MAG: hypothetical protein GY856_52420, partial [bacterium]|nr:hypothetical protein [bacterium]